LNVIEIGLTRYVTRWACVAPFTFDFTVNVSKLANFWTSVFGCPDETTKEKINVMAVSVNAVDRLLRYNNFESVNTNFESYAFNWNTQVLRINFGLNYNPLWDVVDFQFSFGICDRKPITVDGAWYLPVLKSAPTYKIKEDLVNYSRLAMTKLTMNVINNGGELEFLNELTLFNNDVKHYRLPNDERTEFVRADLQPIAGFLIDDVDISLQDGTITGQDVRSSFDVKVPVDLFTETDYPDADEDLIGEPIPLCYGHCRFVPAKAVNSEGTGDVVYRVARAMEYFGSVQVKIDDVWTVVTPVTQDLAHGTFTVAAASARPDDVRECRCVWADGETITTMADVIIALDNDANGVTYDPSFYDTIEWSAEASQLIAGGFYLDKQEKLYDVIKRIQEGCNRRFRYEFNSSLLRTIRIDDNDREAIHYVQKEEIKENGRLKITTDKETIFAYVKIGYGKNYQADTELSVTDESAVLEVARNTRKKPTLEVSTFLVDKGDALARAALDASVYGQVRRFCEFTLTEEKYLTLRVYDILIVELETENRAWMGRWKCKVLSVAPKEPETKIEVCLIERVVYDDDGHVFKISDTGAFKVDESGNYKVAK